MNLISRTAQYAVRAMTLLAAQENRLTVKQLATAVGAPQPYLARIIMILAGAGLVDARRGPRGGLKLGRPAAEVSLLDIITCFDGKSIFEDCFMGLEGCHVGGAECPLHGPWLKVREQIRQWWYSTTLADFLAHHTEIVMRERGEPLSARLAQAGQTRGRWH